ncbi:hypothetical protein [Pedosphaera parvula]|uniref:Uncharacterized protein n=1 Tax=Pedosphaera parvula (strain Ellin514) TaxID=320771 RepID=B9XPM7_PEDPL|nr:hypothetical protein [Pedosphaera parvula]EEF58255.1 hypothetical protein Cflav_PD1455 [Pedosphaera parvula Ellin514]
MEFLKIVLTCILAAVGYGVIHDQFTARVCVEYFTVGHPPLLNTNSPTLLGLFWGVVATWWVGLLLGVPLAMAARLGKKPKLTAQQIVSPLFRLLGFMGCLALTAGLMGYVLAMRGSIQLPDFLAEVIPPSHHMGFVADWWAHFASYFAAFIGGIILIFLNWFRRSESSE